MVISLCGAGSPAGCTLGRSGARILDIEPLPSEPTLPRQAPPVKHQHDHAPHGHSHSHSHAARDTALRTVIVALVANAVLTVVQIVVGLLSGSLALLADSAHQLVDTT